MRTGIQAVVLTLFVVLFAGPTALAGGVKYENEDGDYVKLGGRIQLQYHSENPSNGPKEDELFFRRFRVYVEGSVHEDWKGKFQWDMGKSDLALKDAYMQYSGFDLTKITIGNANFPFSRELITSSKYQQLIERTFVGDHNYGTPDRQTGLHLTGKLADGMVAWGASACKGAIDPDNKKIDFDTVVNNDEDDWSEGDMYGARMELHPFGELKYSQGDFDREQKANVGVAVFTWENDGDNLNPEREKKDVDKVTGMELSAAYRFAGVSIDAEYNVFSSELVDPAVTDGLYENGKTDMSNMAVEGGVMVVPGMVEVVGGYQVQDADNYETEWTRTSVGLNYFVKKHDIKYQVTYRVGENKDGMDGSDLDELFVQAQYVF